MPPVGGMHHHGGVKSNRCERVRGGNPRPGVERLRILPSGCPP